jgi:hypothetical protein
MANELITIDTLRVNTVPAVISGNFAELNTWLDATLNDKKTVVTLDTLSDEKKALAELRKLAKEIDGKTKAVLALVSGDIELFTSNMKALKAKVLVVADDKAAQVSEFESQTKALCLKLLNDELVKQWALLKVDDEFKSGSADELVKLTAMTATGALTKSAVSAVKDKAQTDYQLQVRTKTRLMELENACLRDDINPPLSRSSVDAFLFADDEVYSARLAAVFADEKARRIETERRMAAKLEADKQREIQQALADQQAEANRIARLEAEAAQQEAHRLAKIEAEKQWQIQQAEAAQQAEANRLAKLEAEATAAKNAAVQPEPVPEPAKTVPEPALPKSIPVDAVTYTVTATLAFEFQSRPNANRAKMIDYFTNHFIQDGKQVLALTVELKEDSRHVA